MRVNLARRPFEPQVIGGTSVEDRGLEDETEVEYKGLMNRTTEGANQ